MTALFSQLAYAQVVDGHQ